MSLVRFNHLLSIYKQGFIMGTSKKVIKAITGLNISVHPVTKRQYKMWKRFVATGFGTAGFTGPISDFDVEVRKILHLYVYEAALANGLLVKALQFALGLPVKIGPALKIQNWMEAAEDLDKVARKEAPAPATTLRAKEPALICDHCGVSVKDLPTDSGLLRGIRSKHHRFCVVCHNAEHEAAKAGT